MLAAPRLLCAARGFDDDGILVARCQAGEREAFHLLLSRYRDRVVNLAYSFLYSYDDAEDAAQDVFAAAFATIGSFRGEAQFWTWLYRITVNQCLHRKRRTRQHEELGEEEQELTDIQGRAVERVSVENALDTLSPPHRAVLVLREMHDLSYEEIAATLKIPLGTVRSRLNEARHQFKAAWNRDDTPRSEDQS